ncbi:MAG: Nif3-like dinuclear metal center hexameric protein [Bacteroidales bacterium]|nr:Nif3-like dinuclear metal center hexameric protein [Candidatus Physcocola equi]
MPTTIKQIAEKLEEFAPLRLQESYDNCGLQIGDENTVVRNILVTIDITEEVLEEAKQKNCELIICHHPMIFRGLKHVTNSNMIERCVKYAIKNDIAIYASHTCLDKAKNGVSFKLAKLLGLNNLQPLEREEEGLGCIGYLAEPEDELSFLKRVKELVQTGCIRHTTLLGKKIEKVALCGGAGVEFLDKAIEAQADIYLTGDIKYHDFFLPEKRIILADIGHFESEQFTKELIYDVLYEKNSNFAIHYSEITTNPIKYL